MPIDFEQVRLMVATDLIDQLNQEQWSPPVQVRVYRDPSTETGYDMEIRRIEKVEESQ